jgi:hypothetical protein
MLTGTMVEELLDYGLLSGLQAQSEISELLDELYNEAPAPKLRARNRIFAPEVGSRSSGGQARSRADLQAPRDRPW